MYCNECGNRLREGARFCDDCGAKVVSEEEKNSEVTANNEVTDNVTQLDEEPQELRNDTKEEKNNTAKKKNAAIGYWLMAISLIWLALSGFMPIVFERSIFNKEVYTFMEIGDIYYLFVLNVSNELLSAVVFLCKASYVAGIIFVIVYFLKLVFRYKDSNTICKISLFATILFAIPTLIIFVIQFLINNKAYGIIRKKYLSFTPIGWITLAVIIFNIIVTLIFMLMTRKKKHNINKVQII